MGISSVFRLATQLQGLEINYMGYPNYFIFENGKESLAIKATLALKNFISLGYFKLGDSEAYKVAFQQGTDARFVKNMKFLKIHQMVFC